MKKLEKILLHTCAFAVLISLLFFIVAKIGKSGEINIEFLQYLVIILFALIIAIVNLVFELTGALIKSTYI